jgi:hypothetical protein
MALFAYAALPAPAGKTGSFCERDRGFESTFLRQEVYAVGPFHASDGPFWSGGLRRAVP